MPRCAFEGVAVRAWKAMARLAQWSVERALVVVGLPRKTPESSPRSDIFSVEVA